ncbi:MAG TPA: hypothetical protein VKY74_00305 [Chloroflexia bacterium]|nr:hypothetical protein [Chloroflexia bacterium]
MLTRTRRSWGAALLVGLVAAWAGAYGAGLRIPVLYQATAVVEIADAPALAGSWAGDALESGMAQAPTYAQLVRSPAVLAAGLAGAGLPGRPADIVDSVTALAVPNTNLLEVSVATGDPARSARLANALAAALVAQAEAQRQTGVAAALQGLQAQMAALDAQIVPLTARLAAPPGAAVPTPGAAAALDRLAQTIRTLHIVYAYYATMTGINAQRPLLRVAAPAVPPEEPLAAASLLTVGLVSAVALVLGLATLLALDRLDSRVRGPADLRQALDLPLLGVIPGTRDRV